MARIRSGRRIFGRILRPSFLILFSRFPGLAAALALVVLVAIFGWLSKGKFLQIDTFASILALTAETGFVVLGLVLALTAGVIDLSVGSVYAAGALFLVEFSQRSGWPVWTAAVLILVAATLIGCINGIVITRLGVPSMIATLGMMFALRGSLYLATGGFPRSFGSYQSIMFDILAGKIGQSPVRYSILWLLGVYLICYIVLYHTSLGNRIQATGDNIDFARLMGVNVSRVQTIALMLSAMLAAIGGIISVARFRMVAVTHGEGLEMVAIAAAVIGGTRLTGGFATLLGAFVGAFLVSSVRTALLLMGIPGHWYVVFIGLVLVMASALNVTWRRGWSKG